MHPESPGHSPMKIARGTRASSQRRTCNDDGRKRILHSEVPESRTGLLEACSSGSTSFDGEDVQPSCKSARRTYHRQKLMVSMSALSLERAWSHFAHHHENSHDFLSLKMDPRSLLRKLPRAGIPLLTSLKGRATLQSKRSCLHITLLHLQRKQS